MTTALGADFHVRAAVARARADATGEQLLALQFVLKHGTAKRGRPPPPGLRPGLLRRCYWNALMLSLSRGYAYVEGFAQHPHVSIDGVNPGSLIPHAWNEDPDGRVVDVTWPVPRLDAAGYMGVRFSAWRAHDCTWNRDACVLLDREPDAVTRWPEWTGEDSPGQLAGLVPLICRDMLPWPEHGGPRLAVKLREHARREGWPSL